MRNTHRGQGSIVSPVSYFCEAANVPAHYLALLQHVSTDRPYAAMILDVQKVHRLQYFRPRGLKVHEL